MLSTLVRYQPLQWRDIIAGNENDLIIKIREFREYTIPRFFHELINQIENVFTNIPYQKKYVQT